MTGKTAILGAALALVLGASACGGSSSTEGTTQDGGGGGGASASSTLEGETGPGTTSI